MPTGVYIRAKKTVAERFWPKVATGNEDDCWLWIGATNGEYGQLWNGEKLEQAHVVSYKLHYGELPLNAPKVLHSCDVKLCVNPKHLSAGTQSRNIEEAYERGRKTARVLRGEDNPRASISNAAAAVIRWMYNSGRRYVDIAEILGVSYGVVWRVINEGNYSKSKPA